MPSVLSAQVWNPPALTAEKCPSDQADAACTGAGAGIAVGDGRAMVTGFSGAFCVGDGSGVAVGASDRVGSKVGAMVVSAVRWSRLGIPEVGVGVRMSPDAIMVAGALVGGGSFESVPHARTARRIAAQRASLQRHLIPTLYAVVLNPEDFGSDIGSIYFRGYSDGLLGNGRE